MLIDKIKEAMDAKGFTKESLAKAARISISLIKNIFKGHIPTEEKLKRVARVLCFKIEKFIKPKFDEKLIRKLMIQSGCNQKQFAEKIGIAASTLSNILACRRGIGEKTLSGLKRLYPALIM